MTDAEADLSHALDRIEALTYRLTYAGILRTQLWAARYGALDVDWRTAVLELAAEPLDDISDHHHQQMWRRAAEDVANLPNQDWEPDMKVGWRQSLEAWYTATKQCTDDTEEAQRCIHQDAGLSLATVELTASMDRDLDTASYRAGLTAAGLVSNWQDWLLERVRSWPHGPRREAQLAAMAEPGYIRQQQQLPRYWA